MLHLFLAGQPSLAKSSRVLFATASTCSLTDTPVPKLIEILESFSSLDFLSVYLYLRWTLLMKILFVKHHCTFSSRKLWFVHSAPVRNLVQNQLTFCCQFFSRISPRFQVRVGNQVPESRTKDWTPEAAPVHRLICGFMSFFYKHSFAIQIILDEEKHFLWTVHLLQGAEDILRRVFPPWHC